MSSFYIRVGVSAILAGLAGCSAGGPGSGGGPGGGPPRGGVDAGTPSAGTDVCGNGVDDDGNGRIDDGCSCSPSETQGCWPGPVARRSGGTCRDGVQHCQPSGEFYAWGDCEGAVLPATEIPGNCIDEDCDGVDPGCATCASEFGEVCGDGVDNDCDGLTDCADAPCAGTSDCTSTCSATETACTGGVDDDCDGWLDCADPDCAGNTECPPCMEGCTPGTERWCDDPVYCNWGKQSCGPDGRWGVCVEVRDNPVGCDPSGPFGLDRTYDRDCCVSSGACCENYPIDRTSVGTCTGIERCAT